jgi:hypothetical protein
VRDFNRPTGPVLPVKTSLEPRHILKQHSALVSRLRVYAEDVYRLGDTYTQDHVASETSDDVW